MMTSLLPDIRQRTVPAVLSQAAASHPDKPALRDPGGSYTYSETYQQACTLAAGWSRIGVGFQQPVLLMLDNHLDYVLAWLGLSFAGAVEVPVNTAYKGAILAYIVNHSGARVLVVEDRYCDRLAAVADQLIDLETVVVRDGRGEALAGRRFRVVPFGELREGGSAPPAQVAPWDLAAIMYTSGTTGPSKGVRVPHAHAYGYCTPAFWHAASPDDVTMVTLPLFHIGGQWAGVYNALIGGGSAVVLDGFHVNTFWDDVRRYGCTFTLMLGAVAGFLYRQPATSRDADNPMRRALMVPVIPEVADFSRRFGVTIGTAYGLTEGSSPIFSHFGEAEPKVCGHARDDFDVRIVDGNDIDVPPGEVGELVLRPCDPWSVMDGYHAMPEETLAAWRNLRLHTGDAFYQDEKGRFCFVDRLKDAIRRRGENVSSFEVESQVNEHPAVLESAVVGVASEHTEEEIKAVVARKPGTTLAAEELIAFLADRLPYFMVPRYVEFVPELPKTPTQKIKKQQLREAGVTGSTWDREAAGITVKRT